MLATQQVHRERADLRSPTGRRSGFGRQIGDGHNTTLATAPVGDMVGDHRTDRREVDDLAGDFTDHYSFAEIRAAPAATRRLMGDDLVGCPTVEMGARSALLFTLGTLRGSGLSPSLRRFLRRSTGSPEGGFDEFVEFFPSSASRWAIRSRNASFSVRSTVIASSASSSCWRSVGPATPPVYQQSRAQWWTITLSARYPPEWLERRDKPA